MTNATGSSLDHADQINIFTENAYLVAEHRETGLVGRAPKWLPDAELIARSNLRVALESRGLR